MIARKQSWHTPVNIPHLFGGTEETHENRIAGVLAVIRTWNLLNTSLECYRCDNPLKSHKREVTTSVDAY
jgi:hypothetical protein